MTNSSGRVTQRTLPLLPRAGVLPFVDTWHTSVDLDQGAGDLVRPGGRRVDGRSGCRDLPHLACHVRVAHSHLGCDLAGDLDIVPGDGDVLPGDVDGAVGLHADGAAATMKIDLGLGVDGDLGIERLDHDVLGDVGALGVI